MTDHIASGGIKMTAETAEDLVLVEAYGDGGVKVRGRRFKGGVLVMPEGVYPVEATDHGSVSTRDLDTLLAHSDRPELVLFGMGDRLQLVPKELRQVLADANIGYDPMDTGAAARTYNVLMMEGRRVAALLLPVD